MRPIFVFIIFLLLGCSSNIDEIHFPNLVQEPTVAAYKKNQIKSYFQVLHGVDYKGNSFSYRSDSVNFSKSGNLESLYQLDDFLGGTRYINEYDSLNRITAQEYSSCTHSDYLFEYDFNPKDHLITKYHYELVRMDTILLIESILQLDQQNEKIQTIWKLWKGSNDTIEVSHYNYVGDTLINISSAQRDLSYHYNDVGKLFKVTKARYDEEGESMASYNRTDYISLHTGLIDSTLLNEYNWVKYYHYTYWE